MKWTASTEVRAQMRAFFEKGLGARRVKDDGDTDAFVLDSGCMVGIEFVDPSRALSAAQAWLAPWAEFEVADVQAAISAMEKLSLERVEYFDKSHAYFLTPAGIVFRLAPRTG
jgi:catechol 2,3-dioxygenase-like lactoylglutathione lyase family enzyme